MNSIILKDFSEAEIYIQLDEIKFIEIHLELFLVSSLWKAFRVNANP